MKILLTIPNPPEGMNGSQLFENEKHLEDWLEENKLNKKIDESISIEKQTGKIKEKGIEWANMEEKEDSFKNY
jgi:hypothetical protein